MKKAPKYLLSLFIVFAYLEVLAQDNRVISATFNSTPLAEVITKIESDYGVKFYFQKEWLVGKSVSVELQEIELNQALTEILKGQKLTYIFREPSFFILLPDAGNSNETLTIDKSNSDVISIGNIDLSLEDATLSGYVLNSENNLPINATVITVEGLNARYLSNPNGSFKITLPIGNYQLKFHHPTMEDFDIKIALNSDGTLNVVMFEDVLRLEELVISEQAIDHNISKTLSGQELMNIETIKSIPAIFGEADILNSVLSLPGVSKVGEGSSGINVRGGGVGQNLIMIDNSAIYNPSHLFGFFSAFNADAVSQVSFYRGSIPVEYGGRLSSILDVQMKNGNKKKFEGQGGVGFVNSRFMIEGPIKKDSTSILFAARAAYPSYLIKKYENQSLKRSSAFFGDTNVKIDHLINTQNRLSVSGYLSRDQFTFGNEAEYNYGNNALGLEWNSQLSGITFLESTANYSRYNYQFSDVVQPQLASTLDANVNQFTLDSKFQRETDNQIVTYGASLTSHVINPGQYSKYSNESIVNPLLIDKETGNVMALFASDEFDLNEKFSFYTGLRYSLFVGGKDGLDRTYHGPEPRLSVNYHTSPTSSVKLGYNRMRQYIHFVSNTTSATPIDLWKLSNSSIRPSIADQLTLGYFRNFQNNVYETSVEAFYKNTKDLIEYKNGADLFVNPDVEEELIQGKGRAYGLEFLVKKTSGDFNGWISYTLSRSLIKVKDDDPANTINNGAFFPTNFDQPHNLSAFSNIKLSRRFSINANFTYNTGRPISYPESIYEIRGLTITDFAERNKYRIPDYHRLDVSIVMATSLRREKKMEANWSISVYNVYGRKNTYSIYYKNNEVSGRPRAYQLSVIARPIVAISYNFKF